MHPLTCRKLALIIGETFGFECRQDCFQFSITLPRTSVSVWPRTDDRALAFTGNRESGLPLKGMVPIIQSAFLHEHDRPESTGIAAPAAINERKAQLARELSDAILSNEGQTCSKPGLIFLVENKESSSLIQKHGR